MKRKKLSTLLALVLGLTALSGCTNADQKVSFGAYWNKDALSNTEQIHETLAYDVSFEANDTTLVEYTLNYKDGSYTTTLTSAMENEKLVYTYTTQLNITAEYSFNGKTDVCNDTVTSTVKFYAAPYGLQPISSEKDINASSPTAVTSDDVSDCYQVFHYSTKTVYNADCSEGTTTVTYHPTEGEAQSEEDTFSIDQKKYSYLDNEELLLALRAVKNSTSSATLNVYSPFAKKVQEVSWKFDTEASAEFSFFKNGGESKETSTITYRPVSIALNEKNPGATQTAWIAKKPETASESNKNRNVMLRLETPLSYGLGTLIYTLKSVAYQEV